MVVYRLVDALMIFSMLVVVGIIGVFGSHLYFGGSHCMLSALHRQS